MSNISHGQTADMLRWISKCQAIECDLSTDPPQVMVAVPCEVLGYWIGTVMSAHAVGVADSATNKLTIAASGAAGTYVQFPGAVEFATNLTINPNASSTGKITFFYRLL